MGQLKVLYPKLFQIKFHCDIDHFFSFSSFGRVTDILFLGLLVMSVLELKTRMDSAPCVSLTEFTCKIC